MNMQKMFENVTENVLKLIEEKFSKWIEKFRKDLVDRIQTIFEDMFVKSIFIGVNILMLLLCMQSALILINDHLPTLAILYTFFNVIFLLRIDFFKEFKDYKLASIVVLTVTMILTVIVALLIYIVLRQSSICAIMCVGQSLALSWYFFVQLISCNTKGENEDKVNAEMASMAKETNGSNEVNGANETNDANETNGLNETNDANGTNGANGTNEANGVNKTNGINGVNKTNEINGVNKMNGINGANGANGTAIKTN
ncbi:hypothetical protein F8M41_007243 [Gigaspora margarita]|uniref:Uncharacterized protein n=1 Tax=Gigaspora margarita TaxID=4874 RepID=A0A8H3X8A3_GIGMA|nr:hypothetical protein F8M41_007243 [Gigaspora margarita]